MWYILLLVALGSGLSSAAPQAGRSTKTRRCELTRTYDMWGADCRDLNLVSVPSTIRSDIQVLDLTFNRLRELLNDSFINYASLGYLYLEDNSISFIEQGAFLPLINLEVLDLSWNSLHSVPDALQNLPILRKLNLAKNPFSSVLFLEPLPSVEHLTLSECKLRDLPNLEAFPRLLNLNVSFNRIKRVTVPQLSTMCRLVEIDLRGNKNLFSGKSSLCDCVVMVRWTNMQGIKTIPNSDVICRVPLQAMSMPVDNNTCFTNETNAMFEESLLSLSSCEAEVQEYGSGPIRIRGSVLWTIGALIACMVLIVCVTSVYLVKRRRRHTPTSDRSIERLTSKKERS